LESKERKTLKKIQNGDFKAFEITYKKYFNSLCQFSLSITGNPFQCEDAVQEVFTKFWIHRRTITIKHSIKAYLFKAVYNQTIDLQKQSIKLITKIDLQDIADELLIYENEQITKDKLILELEQRIENLPPRCSEIYKLAKIHKLKYTEIARKLNISVKTIDAQIARANKIIRSQLEL